MLAKNELDLFAEKPIEKNKITAAQNEISVSHSITGPDLKGRVGSGTDAAFHRRPTNSEPPLSP